MVKLAHCSTIPPLYIKVYGRVFTQESQITVSPSKENQPILSDEIRANATLIMCKDK